jgi:hypothetical protein
MGRSLGVDEGQDEAQACHVSGETGRSPQTHTIGRVHPQPLVVADRRVRPCQGHVQRRRSA